MNRPSYNPPGVCKSPIPVRLMDDERRQADEIAEQAGVSRAKVLREAIVAGLPIVRETILGASASSLSTPTTGAPPSPAVDFSGGEAPTSPAGLSSLAA